MTTGTHPHPGHPAPAAVAAPAVQQLDLQLYKVTDAMRVLNLSRTVVFELLRSGRLRSVKQGRSRLIAASAIRDYVALLEREAGRAAR